MNELISRRELGRMAGTAALAATGGGAWAQAAEAKKGAASNRWWFLINEAVTGDNNTFVLVNRYLPLTEYLERQLKGRKIDVEPLEDIARFMFLATGQEKPQLIFGKSVNQLAKLVRDHGYQPLVRRADPYKAAFIVSRTSSIKTLAEVAKAAIMIPDELSATTALGRAELRRQNVVGYKEIQVKYQEGVVQQIRAGLGQVGLVNPTMARKWAEEGGRVLAETQAVMNWAMLASPVMEPAMVNQLQQALLALNTQAPDMIKKIGVKEWVAAEKKDFLDLLAYTKE